MSSDTQAASPQPPPRTRGRPRKYFSEEEKIVARKKVQLNRYYANRDEILAKQAVYRKGLRDDYSRLKWLEEEKVRLASVSKPPPFLGDIV